jgi:hypothetical protein
MDEKTSHMFSLAASNSGTSSDYTHSFSALPVSGYIGRV